VLGGSVGIVGYLVTLCSKTLMTAKLSRVELLLERLEAQGASPAYSFFVAFLVSFTVNMFAPACADA
jgi:hypothetical protein